MKKLLLIAVALFVGLQANAQLFADGGYMHAFETSKSTVLNTTVTNNANWDGFFAGARYGINLDQWLDGLSLAPGANVSFLWSRVSNTVTGREIAINVPVHFVYALNVVSDVKLQFMAGPTLQMGLLNNYVDRSGNATHSYNMYKETTWGQARTPFNLYLGLGIGMAVADRILVNLGFDFGLLNLTTAKDSKLHRNVLKIGVGYIF